MRDVFVAIKPAEADAIDEQEMKEEINRMFERADKDEDGFLTKTEFEEMFDGYSS